MPNAKILDEKKNIVEVLTEKLKSQAGVLVDYSGIKVNEDTEMRVKMREANVDYTVVKNTLMRFAIKNVGFEEFDSILNGTTSLAVSKTDPIAPARIVKEYADKFANYFEIKGGFMDGRVLSVSDVNALANIPALPILQAQLLGTMLAPIASLAVVIKAIAEKGGVPVDANLKAPEEPVAEPAIAEVVEVAEVAEVAAQVPSEVELEAFSEEQPPAEASGEELIAESSTADVATETVLETADEQPAPAKKPATVKTAAKETPEITSSETDPDDALEVTAPEPAAKKPAARKTAAKSSADKPAEESHPADDAAIADDSGNAE